MATSTQAVPAPSRRAFLKGSGLIAGGVVTSATLAGLAAHTARAHDGRADDHDRDKRRNLGRRSDYGKLHPTPDQAGSSVLALPRGFRYVTFSRTGEAFGNGLAVPRNHDGMACSTGPTA